jgi:hypothetical protein
MNRGLHAAQLRQTVKVAAEPVAYVSVLREVRIGVTFAGKYGVLSNDADNEPD